MSIFASLSYLTLPVGKTFYYLALRPLNGSNMHTRINCKVTKSLSAVLTWVYTNTWNHLPPPKWGPTHLDLPTNTHSQYLQKNVSLKAYKHIHPGYYDQQLQTRRPISELSIKLQNPRVQHSPGSTPNWTGITSTWLQWPHAGSGVVRMDPLCFLAGCRTRRLNQV